VIDIDEELGIGTLEYKHKAVRFWWRSRSYQAAVDRMARTNPEMTVSEIPLNVQPGDTIYFRGVLTNGEIFLTGAAVRK
jgi:hypothetical protein